jgi:SAM-dependent methyltransferase/uncharacterized protein YbaR (Trm112 family)
MRRVILNLLRCPRCRRGPLLPEGDPAELVFGPVRCPQCQSTFPVAEGVAELALERGPPTGLQRGMENAWVARSYERYARPALALALAWRRLDDQSEYLLYRTLLGQPQGPILDLGCGTGLFARRLAAEPQLPPVVAMDVSRPMIEEAVAQAREAGVTVDFVRAEAPGLPFGDQSLGAVLHTDALHLMADEATLFAEVARVLRPGGVYVGTTYLAPGRALDWAHQRAGLHPRGEDELKVALGAAGLERFERMRLSPFLLVKAHKPAPAPGTV